MKHGLSLICNTWSHKFNRLIFVTWSITHKNLNLSPTWFSNKYWGKFSPLEMTCNIHFQSSRFCLKKWYLFNILISAQSFDLSPTQYYFVSQDFYITLESFCHFNLDVGVIHCHPQFHFKASQEWVTIFNLPETMIHFSSEGTSLK